MNKLYTQIVDKVFDKITDPIVKKKIYDNIIRPYINDVYNKFHYYIIIIIALYGINILLLLSILFIVILHKRS